MNATDSPKAEQSPSRIEQREADILAAAIQLFSEEGFHSVSTRKIAARAGISEGTLFNYFGAKHELMRGILRQIYGELIDNAQTILRGTLGTRERINALAVNHVSVLTRDNALFMRMLQSYMNIDTTGYTEIRGSVLHEMNLSYAWVFDFAVKEGIARGEIREDVNLHALRDLFFGGLEYGSRSLFLHDALDRLQERVVSLVDPLWQSMQSLQSSQGNTTTERMTSICERLERAVELVEKNT